MASIPDIEVQDAKKTVWGEVFEYTRRYPVPRTRDRACISVGSRKAKINQGFVTAVTSFMKFSIVAILADQGTRAHYHLASVCPAQLGIEHLLKQTLDLEEAGLLSP